MNSVHLLQKTKNGQNAERRCSELGDLIFREREREHLLSRILADRTVGFQRSKKESCSTRLGLCAGTDLVEFRQLQKVGIFSYLR